MNPDFEATANLLAEAERAGGRALTEIVEQVEETGLREILRKAAHDEGYWARELNAYVKRHGGTPSTAMNDFADKVRAVPDLAGKLTLLNRGQGWVVRQIEKQLPSVDDNAFRGLLHAMAEAHRANIRLVDEALAQLPP
jgi:hypothetical protein